MGWLGSNFSLEQLFQNAHSLWNRLLPDNCGSTKETSLADFPALCQSRGLSSTMGRSRLAVSVSSFPSPTLTDVWRSSQPRTTHFCVTLTIITDHSQHFQGNDPLTFNSSSSTSFRKRSHIPISSGWPQVIPIGWSSLTVLMILLRQLQNWLSWLWMSIIQRVISHIWSTEICWSTKTVD